MESIAASGPSASVRRARPGGTPPRDWAWDWGPTLTRGVTRSGTVLVMSTTDNTHHLLTADPTPVELSEELVEVTGGGVRVLEVGLVLFLGLLVCPPLLILAVIVAVPALAISAVVLAILIPVLLVRHVVAHHRAHGTSLFIHRIVRR